jgi:hypothetical protein
MKRASRQAAERFLNVAADALPVPEAELLGELHRFTAQRLAQADALRCAMPSASEAQVHAFLRECWEVLDGLARQVNVCMHHLLPDAGLQAPRRMTRQCTFYTVRKLLHDSPTAAAHPVSRLLWDETKGSAGCAYERLSFLHNVGLFVSLPLAGGRLPGTDDLAPAAVEVIKPQHVEGREVVEGTEEMWDWLEGFAAECYRRLTEALWPTR